MNGFDPGVASEVLVAAVEIVVAAAAVVVVVVAFAPGRGIEWRPFGAEPVRFGAGIELAAEKRNRRGCEERNWATWVAVAWASGGATSSG